MNNFDRCNLCHKNLYSTVYEDECSLVQGHSIDVDLKNDDSDVRLDLLVKRRKISKLWGQITDDDKNAVEFAMVTLLKPCYIRGKIEYMPVATTSSDSMGFYYFEISKLDKGLKYVVSVTKC